MNSTLKKQTLKKLRALPIHKMGSDKITKKNILVDLNEPGDPCLFYRKTKMQYAVDGGHFSKSFESVQELLEWLCLLDNKPGRKPHRLGAPNVETVEALNEDVNFPE